MAKVEKNQKNLISIDVPGVIDRKVSFSENFVQFGNIVIKYKDITVVSFYGTRTSVNFIPAYQSYTFVISSEENDISFSISQLPLFSSKGDNVCNKLIFLIENTIYPFLVHDFVRRIFYNKEKIYIGDITFTSEGYYAMRFWSGVNFVSWEDQIYLPQYKEGKVVILKEENGHVRELTAISMKKPNAVVIPILIKACVQEYTNRMQKKPSHKIHKLLNPSEQTNVTEKRTIYNRNASRLTQNKRTWSISEIFVIILILAALILAAIKIAGPIVPWNHCVDGTPIGECSIDGKFCSENELYSDYLGCKKQIVQTVAGGHPLFCPDGTPDGVCANTKPYFCFEGALIENLSTCGCPIGLNLVNNGCYSPTKCQDGTLNGNCSKIQPKQCIDGELIDRASLCGCLNGKSLLGESCLEEGLNPEEYYAVINKSEYENVSKVYLSKDVVSILNQEFNSNPYEFFFCLLGRKYKEGYLIHSVYKIKAEYATPFEVITFERCPSSKLVSSKPTLGYLHSHPLAPCQISPQDFSNFFHNGFAITGTMCGVNHFAFFRGDYKHNISVLIHVEMLRE